MKQLKNKILEGLEREETPTVHSVEVLALLWKYGLKRYRTFGEIRLCPFWPQKEGFPYAQAKHNLDSPYLTLSQGLAMLGLWANL